MKKIIIAGTLSIIFTPLFADEVVSKTNVTNQSLPKQAIQATTKQAKISLNQADVRYIAHAVRGIGDKRAEAIVQYRNSHGHFKTIAELADVPGIGQRFVAQHRTELEQTFSID